MLSFFRNFFDYNKRELSRLDRQVKAINGLEDKARHLRDDQFRQETDRLKLEISDGKKMDELLPWAYALVREASRRVLGERHYDVQLLAGIALHEGKIAEQRTGEGKTLSATTALYLNALSGKGVHLVTVNDYLARRDAGWMGTVFNFLGLTTAAIISDQSFIYDPEYRDEKAADWRLVHLRPITRKEAYLADITYGINSEFGFDYLRDNMAQSASELVQRAFNFAIIDEADSILIDEARTPHIISAPFEEDTQKYYQYAKVVRQLEEKRDYVIDEKLRSASLTEEGVKRIETILNVNNIYEKDFDTLFHIEAALKAATLFRRDKDYIVKDNQIVIVDEFTGRLLFGRRFSEGIHQAIEAKEGVPIQKESKTLATISLQNYFRMYKKLAGMTGTAATESEEFHKIYKMDVLVIPTHRPMIRKDYPDSIYKTEEGKFNAVVEDIVQQYRKGRPVLVGTTSIEKNEQLSKLLLERGIPHQLLNAKHHEKEAMILAQAGQKQAVTVATNMAGRGVDIILGGQPPNRFIINDEKDQENYNKLKQQWEKKHQEVVKLGGLYVIGTERHESRRIDNQLRGRAGRQGDPGETRFYVSLEDDLMRIFGGEQIAKLMTFFNFPEDQPLSHPMVSKTLEQAQVKVEGFNFDIRKHLVDFDDVLNKQREIIYKLRRKILILPEKKPKEFKETILAVFREELQGLINNYLALIDNPNAGEIDSLLQEIIFIYPVNGEEVKKRLKTQSGESVVNYCFQSIAAGFAAQEKKYGTKLWHEVSRAVYLSTIDKYWTDHLTRIEDLREGINLRGYAQMDPLVEYKNEAYKMFEQLISAINYEVSRRLFKVEVQIMAPETEEKKDQAMIFRSASAINPFSQPLPDEQRSTVEDQSASVNPSLSSGLRVISPGSQKKKPGRNDPCWCGSGKKYKKCHYPD